jgi:signal transduction histidine kinase
LIASYILVTLAVVLLVEALVVGFQVPQLTGGVQMQAQLQAQVDATAQRYGQQLSERYPNGMQVGTVLGERGQPAAAGLARPAADGSTLVVPAITGPISGGQAVTAVVAIAADGTLVASSVPSRYRPGRTAAAELPAPAAEALGGRRVKTGAVSTPDGSVLWTVGSAGGAGAGRPAAGATQPIAFVYVQAPWSPPRFVNPVRAWSELDQTGEVGALLTGPLALLIVTVPVGVLFGSVLTRPLIRRLRRLERAALAVADGDYSVALPLSGRDEIGRLEENFTAMAHQLGSAMAAERLRATEGAREAERARIAREIHDTISQHLFGLRMIAAGMRRADPGNQQTQAIERISLEALQDMQTLLIELRPADLDGNGLAPALHQLCEAYRNRLGVSVEVRLQETAVPPPVEHALLRITQEALVNAVRHGNAEQLTVRLTRDSGHVELTIRDTGTGFDPGATHAGSGLTHMRERAAELGGTVEIDSAPGRGTTLAVQVPVP